MTYLNMLIYLVESSVPISDTEGTFAGHVHPAGIPPRNSVFVNQEQGRESLNLEALRELASFGAFGERHSQPVHLFVVLVKLLRGAVDAHKDHLQVFVLLIYSVVEHAQLGGEASAWRAPVS